MILRGVADKQTVSMNGEAQPRGDSINLREVRKLLAYAKTKQPRARVILVWAQRIANQHNEQEASLKQEHGPLPAEAGRA